MINIALMQLLLVVWPFPLPFRFGWVLAFGFAASDEVSEASLGAPVNSAPFDVMTSISFRKASDEVTHR